MPSITGKEQPLRATPKAFIDPEIASLARLIGKMLSLFGETVVELVGDSISSNRKDRQQKRKDTSRTTSEFLHMGEREKRLEAAGYPLERGPKEGPVIDLLSILGDTLYASGQVPYDAGVLTSRGKVPSQVSVEDATKAAALCAANILRAIITKLGSLDRIERVVRVTGYVNTDPDFADCHLVINGATNLLKDVFGPELGRHARTALGMGQLPLGTSVEVEAIFQLKK